MQGCVRGGQGGIEIDGDRVVIIQGTLIAGTARSGNEAGPTGAPEAVDGHGTVMTGETELGDTIGLTTTGGIQTTRAVHGKGGCGDGVIPQRSGNHRGVRVVWGMADHADLSATKSLCGKIVG